MDGDRSTDCQIGEALLNRVVTDQVRAHDPDVSLNLPDTPVTDANSKSMVDELGKAIQLIGDQLERNQELNNNLNTFARQADKKQFLDLVKMIFDDNTVSWGRIVVLFYAVGKLSVKMLQAHMPSLVSEIVNSCLDFFRAKLLAWIGSMGGWISSISALTQLSLERLANSSAGTIPLSAVLVGVFAVGVLLGGVVVWKLNKST